MTIQIIVPRMIEMEHRQKSIDMLSRVMLGVKERSQSARTNAQALGLHIDTRQGRRRRRVEAASNAGLVRPVHIRSIPPSCVGGKNNSSVEPQSRRRMVSLSSQSGDYRIPGGSTLYSSILTSE